MSDTATTLKRIKVFLWVIIIVGLFYVFFFVRQQINEFNNIGYNFKGIKMGKSTPFQINMLGFMEIDNVLDVGANVYNQSYDIIMNNRVVSVIQSHKEYFIPANQKTIIPLTISIDTGKLLRTAGLAARDILYNPSKVVIQIRGRISVRKGLIRVRNIDVDSTDTLKSYIDAAKGI